MVQNSNIIKKIYFPRLIIPCSAILVSLFDFSIAFLIFIGVSLYYHEIHWSAFIYFPAGILLTLFSAFGIGSFLAALNVKFRDFRYAIPFVLQVLFFASQVIYPLDLIKDKQIKYLLGLNPVNGAIELFRSPITSTTPDMVIVTISFATALLVTFTGLLYFRKTEAYFADIV
jgi:lipopolysaccharide transport system permease protein